MIDKGRIIEMGTFSQLIEAGHMAKLLSDNVRILDESSSDPTMTRSVENNQSPTSLNGHHTRLRRVSVVSVSDSIDVVIPSDAEPMKLVLEDQSVNYNISPSWLYLKAGWGALITLAVYAFFFIIYGFRIGSGMQKSKTICYTSAKSCLLPMLIVIIIIYYRLNVCKTMIVYKIKFDITLECFFKALLGNILVNCK